MEKNEKQIIYSQKSSAYTCPMHPEVMSNKPGSCSKCGMELIQIKDKRSKIKNDRKDHSNHEMEEHKMKPVAEMSFWEKFKMGMKMTMGMEHGGIAGREMAKLMEEDIKFKFFFSLILTIPIVVYSPLGEKIFGIKLPTPMPAPWIMFILATPLYFYSGWIFLYSSYVALKNKTLNMAVLIAVGITAAY